MTRKTLILAILLTLTLTACDRGEPDEATAPSGTVTLNDDYADALPVSSQLAIGTLMLEGSEEAVTVEQAQELLSIWQMLQALQSSGTAAQAELDAVVNQIQRAMTPEQLTAIKEMKLTADSLTDWIQESGLAQGAGGGLGRAGGFQPPAGVAPSAPGAGGGQGGLRPGGGFGTGGDVDPDELQAALAERVRTQAGTMMTRALVSMLEARAAGEEWQRAASDRNFALQRTLLSVIAEATGLDQRDIVTKASKGQTLAQILETGGADLDQVVAQVVAAETERIDLAVAEGTLDQAEADELLTDLEARVRELLEQPLQFGARGPFGETGGQP